MYFIQLSSISKIRFHKKGDVNNIFKDLKVSEFICIETFPRIVILQKFLPSLKEHIYIVFPIVIFLKLQSMYLTMMVLSITLKKKHMFLFL